MGLDMYLTKKTFIGAEYEHRNVKGVIRITEGKESKPIKIDFKRVSYIEERVGYWRKANQIHKWMVENIQDGKDDCGEYDLGKNKAIELLAICKRIKNECPLIEGKVRNGQHAGPDTGGEFVDNIEDGKLMTNSHIAAKLLPSTSGFFFGSTDYDQYYMADIDDTIEILESILSESDPEKDYFEFDLKYSSSW